MAVQIGNLNEIANLNMDLVLAETEKAKTFQIADFAVQKLSGQQFETPPPPLPCECPKSYQSTCQKTFSNCLQLSKLFRKF